MRRAPSIDALIPALYLKGISTGDFTEALQAILGEGASGLSATNIVRLKGSWEEDYKAWSQRDLSQKRYVYCIGAPRLFMAWSGEPQKFAA
jgi:putative transposase